MKKIKNTGKKPEHISSSTIIRGLGAKKLIFCNGCIFLKFAIEKKNNSRYHCAPVVNGKQLPDENTCQRNRYRNCKYKRKAK